MSTIRVNDRYRHIGTYITKERMKGEAVSLRNGESVNSKVVKRGEEVKRGEPQTNEK